MSLDWLDPRFNAPATVLALGALAYLVCVEPLLGRRLYTRLASTRDSDPDVLPRLYRVVVVVDWAWVVLVIAVIAVAPGIARSDLGLVRPTGKYAVAAVGCTIWFVIVLITTAATARRRVRQGRSVPGQQAFSAMLPHTPTERRLALAAAVSAGVGEELLCRGLLIATGVGVFHLPPYAAAAGAVAVFGLAHLYQGWAGVLGTAFVGLIMAGLYLASGSLLLPVLVHIVIDVRALLLVPAPTPR